MFSCEIPIPVSFTLNKSFIPEFVVLIVSVVNITSPFAVNLTAFPTVLINICFNRSGSPLIASGRSLILLNFIFIPAKLEPNYNK